MAKAASWNGEIWMCGDKDKPEQCFSTNLSYLRPQKSSNEGHLTGGLVVTSDTNLLLRLVIRDSLLHLEIHKSSQLTLSKKNSNMNKNKRAYGFIQNCWLYKINRSIRH